MIDWSRKQFERERKMSVVVVHRHLAWETGWLWAIFTKLRRNQILEVWTKIKKPILNILIRDNCELSEGRWLSHSH